MTDYPQIPKSITVHLGAPKEGTLNVTVPFADYIKNVACSEIYPTWPKEALLANIYAEISVALNRVYTEYYRLSGYDFDITSNPAYDQKFVYRREIFDNVSSLVDGVFTTYIRRKGYVEPLFAAFCDGVNVTCQGLSQWGTVPLAEQGYTAEQILKNFYGDNIELVENTPIENVQTSVPAAVLGEGDIGRDVEILQRRLNRISASFPAIPKIYPPNGFFGPSTTDAVKVFQAVFRLDPDGLVGKNTWYAIQGVYFAVKRIYELSSEGLKLSDFSTEFPGELKRGDKSVGVLVLQYYLAYIAGFVASVPSIKIDGDFGPLTENAVKAFEATYGLARTGRIGRAEWTKLQNVYYGLIREIDYTNADLPLPYPGRILYRGTEGEDVYALQTYLSYIAQRYPEITNPIPDGDFGPVTESSVRTFQEYFDLPVKTGRVNSLTWSAITSVYEDLKVGGKVRAGQFSSYNFD